jgi:hypothetical protein
MIAYRDDALAARVQLAGLEKDLSTHRNARKALSRYRNALMDELARLQHAIVWYTNGERYGFNDLKKRDDLSPAKRDDHPKKPAHEISAEIMALDAREVTERLASHLRELRKQDPEAERLSKHVEELQRECASVRSQVEAFAERHPNNPPPPEYRGSLAAILVPVAVTLGLLALGALIL